MEYQSRYVIGLRGLKKVKSEEKGPRERCKLFGSIFSGVAAFHLLATVFIWECSLIVIISFHIIE